MQLILVKYYDLSTILSHFDVSEDRFLWNSLPLSQTHVATPLVTRGSGSWVRLAWVAPGPQEAA